MGSGKQRENAIRILIVDDSRVVRRSIRTLLADEASWSVCGEASNHSEAVNAAVATSPDVILLDLNMPGVSGLETARLIRTTLPEVSIVMMSASDVTHFAAGAELAAVEWVDKAHLATDLVPIIEKSCSKA